MILLLVLLSAPTPGEEVADALRREGKLRSQHHAHEKCGFVDARELLGGEEATSSGRRLSTTADCTAGFNRPGEEYSPVNNGPTILY